MSANLFETKRVNLSINDLSQQDADAIILAAAEIVGGNVKVVVNALYQLEDPDVSTNINHGLITERPCSSIRTHNAHIWTHVNGFTTYQCFGAHDG